MRASKLEEPHCRTSGWRFRKRIHVSGVLSSNHPGGAVAAPIAGLSFTMSWLRRHDQYED
jgi:hypothetical protein